MLETLDAILQRLIALNETAKQEENTEQLYAKYFSLGKRLGALLAKGDTPFEHPTLQRIDQAREDVPFYTAFESGELEGFFPPELQINLMPETA